MEVNRKPKVTFDLHAVRSEFPQLTKTVRGLPLIYFDNAATTLMPQCVSKAMSDFDLSGKANVHRGAHYFSDAATTSYEEVRQQVARFINAYDASEVIFTKGTTEGLNLVAHSFAGSFLKPGDEILVSEMEHHSNLVPWQLVAQSRGFKIRTIPVTEDGKIDLAAYRQLLNEKVKLVAVTYISNSLGTVNPIQEMAQAAHAVDAKIVVDAAQAMAVMPVDIQKLDCDFLAFSAHKMFGPFGMGVLWGKKELLSQMPPYQGGGSMISEVTMTRSKFLPPPQRFEAGTPNVTGVIGLGAAIDFISRQSMADIAQHESQLLNHATKELMNIEGVRIIGPRDEKRNILSFKLEGQHPSDVGALLDQQGVAVRAGHHCTQPLMSRFKIPGTVRASFSIYNTMEEVDAFIRAVKKAREMLS